FERRRQILIGLSFFQIAIFVALSVVMVPAFGSYGAALAPVVVFLISAALMYTASVVSRTAPPYEWRRISAALVVAAAAGWLGHLAGALGGVAAVAAGVAAVAAVPLLF